MGQAQISVSTVTSFFEEENPINQAEHGRREGWMAHLSTEVMSGAQEFLDADNPDKDVCA